MKNYYKRHDGFTLVEIIISIALFTIMMTAIYSMIISTMNNNKKAAIKQTAGLHGQEVFEEIKSGNAVAVKDVNNNIIGISKIGDIDISSNSGKKNFDDDNDGIGDYEATVTITKNSSIVIDKDVNPYKCDISLSGDSKDNLKVNNKPMPLEYLPSDCLKLIVNLNISDDKKKNILIIKDENNKEVLTTELLIDPKKDNKINLTIKFSQYKLKNSPDDGKYKKVKVIVNNQNDIPLYVSIAESGDLDVVIDKKLGQVSDNRINVGMSKPGELYDINVDVTEKSDKTKVVFSGKASQNINVN